MNKNRKSEVLTPLGVCGGGGGGGGVVVVASCKWVRIGRGVRS